MLIGGNNLNFEKPVTKNGLQDPTYADNRNSLFCGIVIGANNLNFDKLVTENGLQDRAHKKGIDGLYAPKMLAMVQKPGYKAILVCRGGLGAGRGFGGRGLDD